MHTEEYKRKIAESIRNHWKLIQDSEYYKQRCRKISVSNKGRISPNKGKKIPSLIGNTNGFKKGLIPWNKGSSHSPETKEKIRQSKLKNLTKYWLGKKRNKETLDKISKSLIGRKSWNKGKECPQLAKENHWNWQGGKLDKHTFYFKNILSPLLREKYSCFICHSKEDLVVHHIDLDKKNNILANLAVICRPHHSKIHHIINEVLKCNQKF